MSGPERKEGVGFYEGKVAPLRCTKDVRAKRKSKNQKRGEIYKQYSTIDSSMFKKQMTRVVFPKIKSHHSILHKTARFAEQLKLKYPTYKLPEGCRWADTYMQIDNAPPHCKRNKKVLSQIVKAASRHVLNGKYYGPKVGLIFQLPNSPDLNVMDLGLFEKLWTKINNILRKTERVATLDEIWDAAKVPWETITPVDIEILFQTLYARMRQVIEFEVHNDMNIPHEGIRERVEAEERSFKIFVRS